MKVTQPDSITKFIKSNELTFEIPVYQRNYVWKIEDCEKLFDDVVEGIKNNRKHYFGNVVYYVAGTDPFTGFTRYVLIDGQQRIEENFRVKLKQVETDRGVYESVIEGNLGDINRYSIIFRNYNKFRKIVKEFKKDSESV